MARTATIQTNFTGGEQTPELRGRVDVNKYYNAVSELYNYVVKTHGGAKRRDGMRFAHEVKTSSKLARLIPFIFSRNQSYALEFGNRTMRVNKDNGIVEVSPGTPYEITTPYADTDLALIRYTGYGDTRFLFHPSFPTQRLTRRGHADWRIVPAPFVVQPCDEQGYKPNTTLTLSAITGTGVTATAGAASYEDADVGREIISGDGRAIIVGFTSTTIVTVDIVDDFASVGPIASGSWAVTLSPVTGITPSAVGVGETITLTADVAAWQDNAQVSMVGMYVLLNDGLVEITGITSDLIADGVVRSELSTTSKASGGAWTLEQKVWTAANGYPRCGTLYEQRLYAAGTENYPVTVWGSKVGEFLNFGKGANDNDSVQFDVVAHETNAIEHLASAADLLPLTYGGEFRMSGGNDNPITPTNIRSKSQSAWGCYTVNPVRVGNDVIYVNRYGKKLRSMAYQFANDRYNSPNIILLSEHLTSTYDPQNPSAEVVDAPIVDLAYQQDPDSRLWAPRSDGIFLACAYDPEQEVVGWSRCQTLGYVESVCVIPFNGGDRVWMLARRTIGGVSKRYVEYMDSTLDTDSALTGAVDSHAVTVAAWSANTATITVAAHGRASGDRVKLEGFAPDAWNVTRTMTVLDANRFSVSMPVTELLPDGPGIVTTLGVARFGEVLWDGYDHLIGETIDVVGDMARLNDKVVNVSGEITTERPVFDIEAGLHFTSRMTMLPIESQAFGTAQGRLGAVYEIVVRMRRTRGLQVAGKEVAFTQHGTAVLDSSAPPFTGDKKLENNGYDETTGVFTIVQPYPLPSEILAVIRKVNLEQ